MDVGKAKVTILLSNGNQAQIIISESDIENILKYAIVQKPDKDTYIKITR